MDHADQASLFADYPGVNVYLVGGAVRDQLLGLPVTERDWVVTGATPELLGKLGFRAVGRGFPVFLHPRDGEEYALARRERKTAPGHTGFTLVADPGVSLRDDLWRRDLTINAMARSLDGELIDPFNGQRDLEDGVLRHVSPAFEEDPLRLLRVARFAARFHRLGFAVADETETLLTQIGCGGELATLPAERIWQELVRALATSRPSVFFAVLARAGAMSELFPQLPVDFADSESGQALDRAADHEARAEVRYAIVCAELGEQAADSLSRRLRAPRRYRDLAVVCARLLDHYHSEPLDAEGLLHVIEQVDALRRPQRFDDLLASCAYLCPGNANGALLRKAVEALEQVDVTAIRAQGLEARELARALRQRRLESVQQMLAGAAN